ncbi:MAG: hypothetical protein AAF310_03810 [Myxococcota bacterium]
MTSKTTRTRVKRASRHKKQGRDRKNALRNHGTTKSREELFQVV